MVSASGSLRCGLRGSGRVDATTAFCDPPSLVSQRTAGVSPLNGDQGPSPLASSATGEIASPARGHAARPRLPLAQPSEVAGSSFGSRIYREPLRNSLQDSLTLVGGGPVLSPSA